MHAQHMAYGRYPKKTVDDAALTAAITLGIFNGMDDNDNHAQH